MGQHGWMATPAVVALSWALCGASGVRTFGSEVTQRLHPSAQEVQTGCLIAWIHDEDGALLAEGWTVSVIPQGTFSLGSTLAVDRDRGLVEFNPLLAGKWLVLAEHALDQITIESTVVVHPGQTTEVRLRSHSVPLGRRLLIHASKGARGDFLNAFPMEPPVLRDPNGAAVPATRTSGALWEFGPVEDAAYSLVNTDPRFKFVSRTVFRRGYTNMVDIVGTSTLRVKAYTADGSEAHALVVRLEGGEQRPWSWYGPPDSLDEVRGLVASTYRVSVGFSAHSIVDVGQVVLVPGEVTTVEVVAPSAATLRGRALDHAGQPTASRIIRVREVLELVDQVHAAGLGVQPLRLDLLTDSAGEFIARGLPAGLFQVSLAPEDVSVADWTEWFVELPIGGELSITLEAGMFGDLHVDCSALAEEGNVVLELTPAPHDGESSGDRSARRRMTSVRAVAAFERLPIGRYKLIGRSISRFGAEPNVLFERAVDIAKQRSSFLLVAPKR